VSGFSAALADSLDPVALARRLGWEPDGWQREVLRSDAPREVIVAHRQAGKSMTSATKAVWVALYEAPALVLLVSPSQRQSDEIFRTCQALWAALGRPVPATADNRRSLELANGSRIVSLPGDEGTIRGFSRARLVVIDEAAYVDDSVLTAVSPMLAVSQGGQLLCISTPFGRRGFFWDVATRPELQYRVTIVSATECPRIAPEFLAAERERMSDVTFRSEWMAEFVEGAGSMFAADDVDRFLTPVGERFDPFQPMHRLRLVPEAGKETA